ncbi:MAG: hypothetical protein CM15mP58_16890 [Burkholderiaceae bacterium]|nr:MAG: hypothetical protein CM15mP58_16890 [Burkholderiaceae bacterium]
MFTRGACRTRVWVSGVPFFLFTTRFSSKRFSAHFVRHEQALYMRDAYSRSVRKLAFVWLRVVRVTNAVTGLRPLTWILFQWYYYGQVPTHAIGLMLFRSVIPSELLGHV